MKNICIVAIAIILSLLSCSKSKIPSDIIPPEKMQAVLWDYIQADVYANEYLKKDSSKNIEIENARLQIQIFQLHKVSKEKFYKSYKYYLNNELLMKGMMDTMMVRQKKVYKSTGDSIRQKLKDPKTIE